MVHAFPCAQLGPPSTVSKPLPPSSSPSVSSSDAPTSRSACDAKEPAAAMGARDCDTGRWGWTRGGLWAGCGRCTSNPTMPSSSHVLPCQTPPQPISMLKPHLGGSLRGVAAVLLRHAWPSIRAGASGGPLQRDGLCPILEGEVVQHAPDNALEGWER